MQINTTYNMDALAAARLLPDECVNCIVTSPPYYALRDYGVDGQIGLEETPEEYIGKLVDVFRELKRLLRKDGTLWVNIGDSYAGSGKGAAKCPENAMKYKQGTNKGTIGCAATIKKLHGYKGKDLIGIPWMLAFALRADGWYLRQDIIWSKQNPMPESVKDRCTRSHEYIFLFSKSARYYFDADAIKQPSKSSTIARIATHSVVGGRKRQQINESSDPMFRHNTNREYEYTGRANKRSVWEVATTPFKEAHFATFPEDLIVPCILSGCPAGGLVLDPFNGSGTTRIVANKLGRNAIGFELNPQYIEIENRRRRKELGMFENITQRPMNSLHRKQKEQ